jgi:microcompartment protein CcmL/EutN
MAMALGDKGLLLLTGSVADVWAEMQAGVKPVRDRGLLVSQVIIPWPSLKMFEEFL